MSKIHGTSHVGGTYGGNPVACWAAWETFEKEKLLERAEVIGTRVMDRFKKMQKEYEIIGYVRGVGATAVMELVKGRATKEETSALVKPCYGKGLVTIGVGSKRRKGVVRKRDIHTEGR